MFQAALALFVLFLAFAIVDGWRAFGQRATGARRARMERSPHYRSGQFENPEPLDNDAWGALKGAIRASDDVSPKGVLGPFPVDPARFDAAPPSGLRVTWLGHSTTLVEIDGKRVLTDPIFGERAGPFSWVGPRRWFPPPIALSQFPRVDVVVVSHDHYDHLDYGTIARMSGWDTTFVVPLGIGANLAYWGIDPSRIVELDWWERTKIGDLEVVAMPARHAAGRMLVDNDGKLWAGYALLGPKHRVYYSGDTGLFPAMRDIGERFGPFDLTMIEVGQYHASWPDWHIGPEQAVVAHQIVRGKVMLPVHWGTLALAYHGWTEPMERALAAGAARGATLVAPRPGESFEPSRPPPVQRWWPDVPWRTGAQDPIASTKVGTMTPPP